MPRPEKRIDSGEKLRHLVADIARLENVRAEKECGIKNLLNPDGTVCMQGFSQANGGIYAQAEVDSDLASVYSSEVSDAGFYNLPFGSPEQRAKVAEWRTVKEHSKSNQVEMAVTVLFNKMLKDEFLVVRSADLDDEAAGTDNLIVNRKTGQVICAIDDVHEGEHDRGKAEKTKRIAQNGGVTVKYGITSRDGMLKRTKLEHVPVFYLGLTSEQFNELLSAMGPDADSAPSDKEKEIFSQFVNALDSQRDSIASLILKPGVRNNITQLGGSLKRLKQIAKASGEPHLDRLPAAA